jgi:dihydroorotase
MQSITLTRPDDFHLHVRDGEAMASVIQASARQFARAIIMPNLNPPVVTVHQAIDYRERILACLPKNSSFMPLMTLFLTEKTDVDEIAMAHDSGVVFAVKYYPAGATTNSENGVRSIERVSPVLEALEEHGLLLLMHGEVTDPSVDIFDREKVFIDTVLLPLLERFPGIRIVLEHITTSDAADLVMHGPENLAATITPQHLLLNRNALFAGGLRPHHYCLPILKAEAHRLAIVNAATSGHPRVFLGTDSAPHARHLKESVCGCAGIYTALNAMELYADVFENEGKLDKLEAFAGHHGADFYGLPRNTDTITLIKEDWTIPETVPFGADKLVPFRAGETCHWKFQ